MGFDRFEVRVDPSHHVRWPGGGDSQPVELRVNGSGLIDIVREVELPYAIQEFDERLAAREPADELGTRGWLAGNYLYPNGCHVFRPSRNLLGEPFPHGFLTEDEAPRNRQSLLLHCTCGITECWFLLVTITLTTDTVIWSDFRQFHREWQYNLGPFTFDRKLYEAQLVPPRVH